MNEKQQCQTLNGAITKIEGLEGKLANLINQCTSDIFVDSVNNIEILKMKLKEARNDITRAKQDLQSLADNLVNNSPWWRK